MTKRSESRNSAFELKSKSNYNHIYFYFFNVKKLRFYIFLLNFNNKF
jgi:hypothetical protein